MAMFTCSGSKEHDLSGYSSPKFCPICGCKTIEKRCQNCNFLLNDRQAYCEKCGHKVGDPVEAVAHAKESSEC